MGVNFPTAFWKNSSKDRVLIPVEETVISWSKNLYYGEITAEDVEDGNASTLRTFPFDDVPPNQDFYPAYDDETQSDDLTDTPYYGWYLDGNTQYNTLSRYHRADPWIQEDEGRKLNLFFEADLDTLDYLGWSETLSRQKYNQFIQSGRAIGTFSLDSSATMQVLASGLGERYDGNTLAFDRLQLYVDSTLICRGYAPEDDDERPWDMNHCKFFNIGGTRTPPSYSPNGNRDNLSTNLNNGNGGLPYTNIVDQNQRTEYVREAARFTGSISLGAGAHTISIYYNTNDGLFNSGAFYGTTFSFS